MSDFLDLAILDDIPEQVVLDDGSEHTLQIMSTKVGVSNSEKNAGQNYLMIGLKSIDIEDSSMFNEVMMIPHPDNDKENFNNRGRALARFFNAFAFDYHGFNYLQDHEQLKGLTATAVVKVNPDKGDGYGESNSVRTYL